MAKNNHSIGNADEFYVLAQLAQRGHVVRLGAVADVRLEVDAEAFVVVLLSAL